MSKKVLSILIIFVIFMTAVQIVSAQSNEQQKESSQKTNPPVTVANSEQFTLFSSNTQQEYKIYIHLPFSYSSSDTTYPVIYALDADIGFAMSSEMSTLLAFRKEMPEIILVGIAYGAYPGQEGNNRTRDYTPTINAEYPNSGNAESFFRFIHNELIPVIESKYKTNPEDRTISGASLGGLFSLYVLFQHPDVFNRYKISSPSLWWDDGVTFEYEKKYAETYSNLSANVFISVGDTEPTTESWKKFVQVLKDRNYENLKLTTMIFDDAPHITACILGGVRGIKYVFSDD